MSSANNGGGSEKWYLRKSDGSEYGPAALDDLARWAAESRVVSGNTVSRDRKTWLPVEEVPELGMEWTAHLADGRKYGPFNILATRDLHRHKVLPADARLAHVTSGEDITVAEWLKRPTAEPSDAQPPSPSEPADRPQSEATADAPEEGTPAAPEPKKRRRPRRRHDGTQRELWDAGGTGEADAEEPDAATQEGGPSAGADAEPAADDRSGEEIRGAAGTSLEEAAPEDTVSEAAADPVVTDLLNPEDAEVLNVEDAGVTEAQPAMAEAAQAALHEAEALRDRVATLDKLMAATARQLKSAEAARVKAEAEIERLRADIGAAAEAHAHALEEAAGKMADAEDRVRQALAARDEVEAARQELEQRLQATGDEIATAHADEARATAALRGAEAANLRKTQVFEKRIKDLLDERNDLTRLVEKQAARLKLLRLASIACLVVAGLALAFGVVMNLRGCTRRAPAAAGQPAAGAPAAAPAARAAAVQPAGGRRPVLPIINAVPGARTSYDRSGCAVIFDAGVFSSATTVTPAAMSILQRLVPQLKPYLSEYDLVVEGYTDNQPLTRESRYSSNADLAMARARAFARVLSSDFGIPLAAMRAAAGDTVRAPYPNDTETSRARNRTVVLRLVRHAGN